MEKAAAAVALFAGLLFFGTIIGPLFGGLGGWVVGFFWTDPILDFLRRFGVDTAGLSCWQIGVALGFIGGFLKTSVSQSKSN